MKFIIVRASDKEDFPIPVEVVGKDDIEDSIYGCEITSLEELLDLADKCSRSEDAHRGGSIIVCVAGRPAGFAGKITIYDDYLE